MFKTCVQTRLARIAQHRGQLHDKGIAKRNPNRRWRVLFRCLCKLAGRQRGQVVMTWCVVRWTIIIVIVIAVRGMFCGMMMRQVFSKHLMPVARCKKQGDDAQEQMVFTQQQHEIGKTRSCVLAIVSRHYRILRRLAWSASKQTSPEWVNSTFNMSPWCWCCVWLAFPQFTASEPQEDDTRDDVDVNETGIHPADDGHPFLRVHFSQRRSFSRKVCRAR